MKSIFRGSKTKKIIKSVAAILEGLTFDPVWTDVVLVGVLNGETDIRSVLFYLAQKEKPTVYLETGVRRGWSMACVAAAADGCRLIGFDKWVSNYGGSPNPGPDFVIAELSKINHNVVPELVSGDTSKTLSEYVSSHSDLSIDLALVDGDHSREATTADLNAILSRLSNNGYIVIDDLHDLEIEAAWLQFLDANKHLVHARDEIVGIARNTAEGRNNGGS